jgi:hypothetical protein
MKVWLSPNFTSWYLKTAIAVTNGITKVIATKTHAEQVGIEKFFLHIANPFRRYRKNKEILY